MIYLICFAIKFLLGYCAYLILTDNSMEDKNASIFIGSAIGITLSQYLCRWA